MIPGSAWIWFLERLGADAEFVRHLDRSEWEFARPTLFFVGLAALLPIGWRLQRRHRRLLGQRASRVSAILTALRMGVAAALLFALAGPALRIDASIENKPVVSLLVDRSLSMSLPVGPDAATSRFEAVRQTLAGIESAVVKRWRERFDFRLRTFGAKVEEADGKTVDWRAALSNSSPDERRSDLGLALRRSVPETAEVPFAVFLLSDGQQAGSTSPTAEAQKIRSLGGVVHCVPIGPRNRIVDLAMVEVVAPGVVHVGDSARVAVTVESHGMQGRTVPVRLRDGDRVLAERELTLRDGEQQRIELECEFPQPGDRWLAVDVPVQPEERPPLHLNNADVAAICVSDETRRVLYLEGVPRWDYRFLRNAMRRDHALAGLENGAPDIFLESESAGPAASPLQRGFDKLTGYHAIIVGDVSPATLTATAAETLARLVKEKGVGLIVAAGPRHPSRLLPPALLDLLPVRFDAEPSDAERSLVWKIEPTPAGAAHPLMQLADNVAGSNAVWALFDPVYWMAPAARAKIGASTLAQGAATGVDRASSRARPAVVLQQIGQGKVLFVGVDSTWQWRRNVGDRYFYRFWSQALAFVAREDADRRRRSRIEFSPSRMCVGEPTTVTLHAFDAHGGPIQSGSQSVEIDADGSTERLELASDNAAPGKYEAQWTPTKPGQHRIHWKGAVDPVCDAAVRVAACPEEFRRPNVQRSLLAEIAAAGGGSVVEQKDLQSAIDALSIQAKSRMLRRRLPLADNAWFLVVVAGMFCIDVALRRFHGLA